MSKEPDDSPPLALEEVSFDQLGAIIEALVEQLGTVANRAEANDVKRDIQEVHTHGVTHEDVIDELDRRTEAVVIRTLSGLKQFRRNYEYWERAIAEYALEKQGLSQRDVARYLGVAASTVNRWAQNPLEAQDARD
ncbi:helix-turn-helix domain-containing protein [Salinibacterium sp. NSLL150]|uniref:helix-turn-helix domain-containing protein n=1 Tax=unclassified Salinibacterium TaxID=2632331 RepID=UPI0018CF92BF|nr:MULTISPECIES: helix-turn-helix transcriptional regulator [unclassified Salinibacterium]MBH0099924.1 helix-turn-helix domain-containing protein [Salinibacterium sp. NSLL35]MBH0102678.1 helix-turn-helix domain-containing protein [Salinibacterium sp. NSLL150]MBH0105438.1 helix-turn-helix domain-containing protein [Salinibacterium sp. NSLL16]MBH0108198.1 helix-turn-helix domain-containing protein [Salinibacterium sp. NSLL17]